MLAVQHPELVRSEMVNISVPVISLVIVGMIAVLMHDQHFAFVSSVAGAFN